MGAMKKKTPKPETLNMRGAAMRSLRTSFQHYLDWQRADCEDRELGASQADVGTFLDWVKDELEETP